MKKEILKEIKAEVPGAAASILKQEIQELLKDLEE